MFRKAFLLAALLWVFHSSAVFSQTVAPDTAFLRNEIGIDVTNILTFLRKNTQSYLFNYKRHFSPKHALRFGMNLDLATEKEKGYYADARLGYEYKVNHQKWQYFTGADFSGAYTKSNLQPNRTYQWGLSPLIGARYYISRRFSVATEAKLNFYYLLYRVPGSFDSSANTEEFNVNIGSVGMIHVNYHFNFRN